MRTRSDQAGFVQDVRRKLPRSHHRPLASIEAGQALADLQRAAIRRDTRLPTSFALAGKTLAQGRLDRTDPRPRARPGLADRAGVPGGDDARGRASARAEPVSELRRRSAPAAMSPRHTSRCQAPGRVQTSHVLGLRPLRSAVRGGPIVPLGHGPVPGTETCPIGTHRCCWCARTPATGSASRASASPPCSGST